jgi:glycosyltransferase involved in cell wall biosynthesis
MNEHYVAKDDSTNQYPKSQFMNQGEIPLVSVVTPAYNEEQYIGECIDSVIRQTYSRWHLVVVDNASTDRTFDIAQSYAAKDRRIGVVRNETTVPVIENYNIAFRQLCPQAKYCKVVAADDWLYPECLEQMVRIAEGNPNVALIGAYSLTGRRVEPREVSFTSNVVCGRDVSRSYLSGVPYLLGAPTPLMFRADVIRSQPSFFRQQKLHADAEACLEVLQQHDYAFVPQILTFSRVRETSLTSDSQRLNVYIPNRLEFLINFGPRCFSKQELKQHIHDLLVRYYTYLGSQVLCERDQVFWSFHRRRLSELGYPLNKFRLMVNAILDCIDRHVTRKRF